MSTSTILFNIKVLCFRMFSYTYFIRVTNTAGSTDSPPTTVTTSESAPSLLLPPIVTTVSGHYDQLFIQWFAPDSPNGRIRNYVLQRNNTTPWSFAADTSQLSYTDHDLVADTVYSYTVAACTGGGCTTSRPTSAKTLESSPGFVAPPTAMSINSTAISISWSPPQITNGQIVGYRLQQNGTSVFSGLATSFIATDLAPFETYSFVLTACTGGGCASSAPATCRTGEAPPYRHGRTGPARDRHELGRDQLVAALATERRHHVVRGTTRQRIDPVHVVDVVHRLRRQRGYDVSVPDNGLQLKGWRHESVESNDDVRLGAGGAPGAGGGCDVGNVGFRVVAAADDA